MSVIEQHLRDELRRHVADEWADMEAMLADVWTKPPGSEAQIQALYFAREFAGEMADFYDTGETTAIDVPEPVRVHWRDFIKGWHRLHACGHPESAHGCSADTFCCPGDHDRRAEQ